MTVNPDHNQSSMKQPEGSDGFDAGDSCDDPCDDFFEYEGEEMYTYSSEN